MTEAQRKRLADQRLQNPEFRNRTGRIDKWKELSHAAREVQEVKLPLLDRFSHLGRPAFPRTRVGMWSFGALTTQPRAQCDLYSDLGTRLFLQCTVAGPDSDGPGMWKFSDYPIWRNLVCLVTWVGGSSYNAPQAWECRAPQAWECRALQHGPRSEGGMGPHSVFGRTRPSRESLLVNLVVCFRVVELRESVGLQCQVGGTSCSSGRLGVSVGL